MKDKTVSALLALFFGSLGIHRFYLGQTGLGVLYIVLLFIGISPILGIIDCIIFMSQSREAFDNKYNSKLQLTVLTEELTSLKTEEKRLKAELSLIPLSDNSNQIFRFIKEDIKSLPDNSYELMYEETNTQNQNVKSYKKVIRDLEFNIFAIIEKKVIGDNGINVSLITKKKELVTKNNFSKLLNQLYEIYGPDSTNIGGFSANDWEEFTKGDWSGRSWLTYSTYKYPALISSDEYSLTLTIWGVQK